MPDFDSAMGVYADAVERYLAARFARAEVRNTPYQPVLDAMAYSLLGGGKRIRGVMTLAFYHLFDRAFERALPFAGAIEMVHAYSLVHDDLPCMDDDDMRRGKPSCHIAFGESTALLAGDGLLTMAFETALAAPGFPPDRLLGAVRALAAAAGVHGMIGGQVMDLAAEGKRLTAEGLDAVNLRKTGALFQACAEMGCVLGGAGPQALDAARDYARQVGRAFQVVDDMLDITADPAKLGKPVGSDAENQKNTYAALFGLEECRKIVADHNREAGAALERIDADTGFLATLADRLAGREF